MGFILSFVNLMPLIVLSHQLLKLRAIADKVTMGALANFTTCKVEKARLWLKMKGCTAGENYWTITTHISLFSITGFLFWLYFDLQ